MGIGPDPGRGYAAPHRQRILVDQTIPERPPAARADLLRALGIEVAFGREGRAGSRVIKIRTTFANTVSTVSSVRHQGSRLGSKQPQPADPVRDDKYRPVLVSPCSIGQASVTAADDAHGADANAAFCVGS